jgi:multiple sugar transport system permease protein
MGEFRRLKRITREVAFFAGLLLLLAMITFPFYWMIKTSMDTGTGIFAYPPKFLPSNYTF